MRRVLTAAVLLPLLWAAVKLAPAPVFVAVAMALIVVAAGECYTLAQSGGGRPFTWLGLAAMLAVAWSFADMTPRYGVELPLVAVTVLTGIVAMARRKDAREMAISWVHTLFPVLFVGLTLAYTVRLRVLPGDDGQDLLLLLFGTVIASDTVAYYAGTRWGRRRLAPRLSPKKSWEGAVAGVLAGLVVGLIAHYVFFLRLPLGHALAASGLVAVAGIVGDLAESLVKRAAGAKDSSSLLPGHGGLLDRADAILFTAPTLYYYYVCFLEGLW